MNHPHETPDVLWKQRRKYFGVLIVLIVGILTVFFISMNTGFIKVSPVALLQTLAGQGTAQDELILFEFRLPRIVLSVLAGICLAISGAILQAISRNALADPGILGINAGAGFAVMLYITYIPAESITGIFLLPLLALLGSGATAALIYILAYKKGEGISPIRLLLTGIAVAAGISAAMIVLTLRLSPEKYQFIATWLAGSIWGSNWHFVIALLPWLVLLLPIVYVKASEMNLLRLEEGSASGLGLPIEKNRRLLLAVAVGLSGASVAVTGGIGFVGLIAPHLAKQLVGARYQYILPVSALVGGLLVLLADTIGRWLLQPSEIPAGIVVSVIGAPYFLYLLTKAKN